MSTRTMMTTSTIQNVIAILNSHNLNILAAQKFMLLAKIQRAAKLGDGRVVKLRELNTEIATRH